jgi:hypothetical protein
MGTSRTRVRRINRAPHGRGRADGLADQIDQLAGG